MTNDDRVATAAELMAAFADRTGSSSQVPPRRYLWTDAFAVCNLLALQSATGDGEYLRRARLLVDQVHETLGKHRPDDVRSGWISGLGADEGSRHPTIGGLRIGKPQRERAVDEPFDARLEWQRDGQYFHYLTKWMHALDQMSRATMDARFNRWARELAATAHRAFSATPASSSVKQLVWKKSIDLSRTLVSTMGQHDPLDGYVTCLQLTWSRSPNGDARLRDATSDFARMIDVRSLATSDPLGIGGLLIDACRLSQLAARSSVWDERLLDAIVAAAGAGLEVHLRSEERRQPATNRLAFRELGLAIGLSAIGQMRRSTRERIVGSRVAGFDQRFGFLRDEIESFWLRAQNRAGDVWREHADINDVMLATSLVPDGLLVLRRPSHRGTTRG